MSKNPICEPFTNLPVKFDIEKLAQEFKTKELEQAQAVQEDKQPRDFLDMVDQNWVVLPSFKYQLDHLKPYLSIRNNPYMRCRWRQFLNNVPSNFVTISLMGSLINNKPMPRKKSLNGQFYGDDYKLAPIPVAPDPRNYGKLKKTPRKTRTPTMAEDNAVQ